MRYDDLTVAIHEAMRVCGIRASAAIWGLSRDSWGQHEARSLRLYVRDLRSLMAGELESALLGDDLTWEDLDDSEAQQPVYPATYSGLVGWKPTTQSTKETSR